MNNINDGMDGIEETLKKLYIEDPNAFLVPHRLFAYLCDHLYEDREGLLKVKAVILSGVCRDLLEMRNSNRFDFRALYDGRGINGDNLDVYSRLVRSICEILGFEDRFVPPEINTEREEKNVSNSKITLGKDDGEKSADEYYNLACVQKTAKGIENAELYIGYMKKASDLGHRLAMHTMARFLYKGKFVEKDVKAAIELLIRCVEDGQVGCLYEIADLYHHELNDSDKYFEFLKKAVEADVKEAKYELAMLYYNNGLPDDYVKAVQILKSSVEDGDINSMYQLALCYRFGQGVTMNMGEAMELLRQAAKNGHSKAREIVGG